MCDAFEEKHEQLEPWVADPATDYFIKEASERYLVTEDRDEYLADYVSWVPPQARWSYLQGNAKQPEIGKLIDDAMVANECDNPSLRGVLPKDYARPSLDKQQLGELIDLIGTIGLGDAKNRGKDILGRFASAQGKGGAFYTP